MCCGGGGAPLATRGMCSRGITSKRIVHPIASSVNSRRRFSRRHSLHQHQLELPVQSRIPRLALVPPSDAQFIRPAALRPAPPCHRRHRSQSRSTTHTNNNVPAHLCPPPLAQPRRGRVPASACIGVIGMGRQWSPLGARSTSQHACVPPPAAAAATAADALFVCCCCSSPA